ncbi:MAG TPA: hypothetical protein VKF81_04335 [Blastocatellia bacterium]|nr:hypothetical protein [Blastocatellia bacterium]
MSQPSFCSVKARHYRANWAVQRLAYLAIAQATNGLKKERQTILLGQLSHGIHYLLVEDLIEVSPVFHIGYLWWGQLLRGGEHFLDICHQLRPLGLSP